MEVDSVGSIFLTVAMQFAVAVAKRSGEEFGPLAVKGLNKGWQYLKGLVSQQPSTAKVRQVVETEPELREGLSSVIAYSSGLKRLKMVAPVLEGARILWVDDNPENNGWERGVFTSLGADCIAAKSTPGAIAELTAGEFDLVLSDIRRGQNPTEGIKAIPMLRAVRPNIPIIFYVGHLKSTIPPKGAQGITNHPNELIHLVLDQLERYRV